MSYQFPIVILLIQLSSLGLIFSSAYIRPNKYFINCGSNSDTNSSNGRIFLGDSNSRWSFSTGESKSVKDNNPVSNTPILYHTARIYKRKASYDLEVDQNSTYIVRLHFFPFPSRAFNLFDAVFSVSASGHSLLSNFSARTSSSSPVEEFLLSVAKGTFSLYFVPFNESSFAFVNAIEVFPAPESFVPDSASRVASSGSNGTFPRLLSLVLHTVHRINVGGDKITPESDTLWRTWIEDDAYITGSKEVSGTKLSGEVNYNDKYATRYTAPDYVYKSARYLKSVSQANSSRISWGFQVSEKVMHHLVRLHFCDIFSLTNSYYDLSLFIYDNFSTNIDPYVITSNIETPFYFDFVVDTSGSGSINVSIGLPEQLAPHPTAFLNGLEIFEIQNASGPVPPKRPKSNQRHGLVIGLIVSCVVIVGVLIPLFLFYKQRTRKSGRYYSSGPFGGTSSKGKSSEGTLVLPSSLNLNLKISFDDIKLATRDFDEDLLIGKGGFGKVYRGHHKDKEVAVKRGNPRHGQGLDEFQTEIIVLSQINHIHLVSLLGYCNEMSEMILVYEFMEKGTLRDHLYDSKDKHEVSPVKDPLPWDKRLEICIGAAEGLEYLHTGLAEEILHHDVKSTNILLDKNYVAKVADFGLSKFGPDDANNECRSGGGSFGYFDPEYITSSLYTAQSDVYSFGVVLLEVICARPVIFTLPPDEESVNLVTWVAAQQRKGLIETIVDQSLVGKVSPDSLRIVRELAEKCVSRIGSERPTMKQIGCQLKQALQLQKNSMQGEAFDGCSTNVSMDSILLSMPSYSSC